MILGRDILRTIGVKIDFHLQSIVWMGRQMPMKLPIDIAIALREQYLLAEEEDYAIMFKTYADDVVIKDRKYHAVLPEEVAAQLNHLTLDQKQQLQKVFVKYKRVFEWHSGKESNR